MVAALTTDGLLSRIKARAQIPAADGRLTDAEILAICDDAHRSSLARLQVGADDGRMVKTAADQAITADQARYRIPSRALEAGTYDVLIVDSDGEESSSVYVDSSEAWRSSAETGGAGTVYRHTIEGDEIVLLPTPATTYGQLRVKYRRAPSRLVPVASCALISSSAGTTISSADSVPSGWGSSETLDVVEGTPSGDSIADDVAGTSIGGASITVAAGVPSEAAAGDYVCLAGETCVPSIPAAAEGYFVLLCTYEVMLALGDVGGAGALQPLLAERKREATALMYERSRQRPIVVNRSSHLRGGRRSGRRWGWGS